MTRIVMKLLADPPPTGSTHPATLAAIEGLTVGKPLDFGHGPSLRFVLRLSDPQFKGMEATTLTGVQLNQKSKLYRVAQGLLGSNLQEGQDVTDALKGAVGKPCLVTVEHREARDGNAVFLEAVEIKPAP